MKKSSISKKEMVRRHLLQGKSITTWEAIKMFNATRLSAIIFDLKRGSGYHIDTEQITGEGANNYVRYFIAPDAIILDEMREYVKRGGRITNEIAFQVWGCDYPLVIINTLEKEGLSFKRETLTDSTGKTFDVYYL